MNLIADQLGRKVSGEWRARPDRLQPMPINDKLLKYVGLLLEPRAIRAIATWPLFSVTSFKMVSALARQGILPRTVIDVGANAGNSQ